MKIVSLTKTFRGEEFCIPSLESIYPHCHKVIYAHSNVSWQGEKGNTVKPKIEEWCANNDKERKVINLDNDEQNQEAQYNFLSGHAEKVGCDLKLLIDTDEIMDEDGIPRCIEFINRHPNFNSYWIRMHSYIKSPFYRIDPKDVLCPCVFIRKGSKILGCRGRDTRPVTTIEGPMLHHFCSVRKSFDDVWAKHMASCGTELVPLVDKDVWVKKWNALPAGSDLLPVGGYEHQWKACKEISIDQLPKSMRQNPLVLAFKDYNFKNKHGGLNLWAEMPKVEEMKNDKELSQEAQRLLKTLPADFGPHHPQWKVPSMRNRYLMAMGVRFPKAGG